VPRLARDQGALMRRKIDLNAQNGRISSGASQGSSREFRLLLRFTLLSSPFPVIITFLSPLARGRPRELGAPGIPVVRSHRPSHFLSTPR
jgi:hypothetical protein